MWCQRECGDDVSTEGAAATEETTDNVGGGQQPLRLGPLGSAASAAVAPPPAAARTPSPGYFSPPRSLC